MPPGDRLGIPALGKPSISSTSAASRVAASSIAASEGVSPLLRVASIDDTDPKNWWAAMLPATPLRAWQYSSAVSEPRSATIGVRFFDGIAVVLSEAFQLTDIGVGVAAYSLDAFEGVDGRQRKDLG